MTSGGVAPATLPPEGLHELDPTWSRLVTVPGLDGTGRTFHVLDNGVPDPEITLLCVHGNPSWSYLWRDLLAGAGPRIRVVAPDHLDMGFSERTGAVRRLRRRIDDLDALSDHLDLGGRVVTVGHDWGGPISLGWALRHRDDLAGIVLANTAVHQPEASPAPRVIRIARTRALLDRVTVKTSAFVRGAVAMSRTEPAVRDAFLAPYRSAERRAAVGTFVDDIPLDPEHPSAAALDEVAAGLAELRDVPSLLLWGPSDPVFSDLYLHDLERRLPRADVHRFAGASHYVTEDADVDAAVLSWVADLDRSALAQPEATDHVPLWSALERRAGDGEVAIREMTGDGPGSAVTFAALAADVEHIAAGLQATGVRPGDRVALLVTPGIDLAALVYGCWRLGAVVVIADAGLGPRGVGRALASAAPDALVGVTRALAAARALRWPGRRIAVESVSATTRRGLGVEATLEEIRLRGTVAPAPAPPGGNDLAAVAFTSGATGPAKGVRYRHRQGRAQIEALENLYDIGSGDRLVAAFAPFALYGPAMGIPSVVPDMDLTAPGTLTAAALADAVRAIDATLVFASPAALRNVVATAGDLAPAHHDALAGVRLLMSAGAPVSPDVLRAAAALIPNAEAHTPYGMTEVLPVADISLAGIDAAGGGNGVCVGVPVPGVDVMVDPLDGSGRPTGTPVTAPSVTGEVLVRAAHMRDGYDRLWLTEHLASTPRGWHRTGDVGHLDEAGRLWIEGRLAHVISTPAGPMTPVGTEHAVEAVPDVHLAAVVGVGPPGTQQVVVVVAPSPPRRRPGLADGSLAAEVRAAAGVDVAAVLTVPEVPVDVRHNSKIDRIRLARWASRVLAGGRMGRP